MVRAKFRNGNGSGCEKTDMLKYSSKRSTIGPLPLGPWPLLLGLCVPGSPKPGEPCAPESS